jgi:hypothetical protein
VSANHDTGWSTMFWVVFFAFVLASEYIDYRERIHCQDAHGHWTTMPGCESDRCAP